VTRKRKEEKPLQAVYTVSELAEMAGLSTRRMRRELDALDVPVRRPKKHRTGRVYLSDLVALAPDLAHSMATKKSLEDD
jgi:hypothetical protein